MNIYFKSYNLLNFYLQFCECSVQQATTFKAVAFSVKNKSITMEDTVDVEDLERIIKECACFVVGSMMLSLSRWLLLLTTFFSHHPVLSFILFLLLFFFFRTFARPPHRRIVFKNLHKMCSNTCSHQ